MLTASTEKNEIVQLSMHAERAFLRQLRKNQQFYCPACKERVILKVGEVIIPHFAHVKNQSCTVFSEGETTAHLEGKHLLYNWFKRQSLPVIMEPYLGVIRQRPDLLIKKRHGYVAIEFQCSSIQTTQIKNRTTGYMSLHMESLWIGVAKKELYNGLQKMKISQFHQHFIGNQLLTLFDIEREILQHIRPLLHISGLQYISHNKKINLTTAKYPLFKVADDAIDVIKLKSLWYEERQRFLVNRIRFNKKGLKDPFFHCSYIHKITLLDLPNWIGIPSSYHGKSHSVEWQLIIVLLLKTVDADYVYTEFKKRFPSKAIPIEAVEDYVRFIKRHNPKLLWKDVRNDSISEEIITQYVALKFDN